MLTDSLKGLKVVDFTQVLAGPCCTLMLADLGADVVKIEAPSGDLCRNFPPFHGGESGPFLAINRNKRGIVLNLKDPAHNAVAQKLAREADVVVESNRPGVMARLGLGYDTIAKDNPSVIYCSVSAYGQSGPWSDRPGVDGVVQAVSGLMSVTGPAGGPACKSQVPIADMATGYLATIAVLAAIHKRAQTGEGQHIDINMFASAVAMQMIGFTSFFVDGEVPSAAGSAVPYAAPNEALRCADGHIMVAAYQPARWAALCQAIGAPELKNDPRFADLPKRIVNRPAMVAALEERLLTRTSAEWQEILRAADIICAPVNDYAQAAESEQFAAADIAEVVQHPAGAFRTPRNPIRAIGEATAARRPPPLLGEHTREVLAELGYPANEIDRLTLAG